MIFPWFKRKGLIYTPTSFMGWFIVLAVVIYSVYIFIDIDSRSHSVSDTLMNFVFNLFLIGIIYTVLAYLTSRKKS